jgi:MraZ protein
MTKLAFLSTFTATVDDKFRLSIPADYRDALAPGSLGCLVFSPGPAKCLTAFPLDYFQAIFERMDSDSPEFVDAKQRERYAVLFHDSVQRKIDAQGRVTLPKELLGKAGIGKEVVFAGERTHFSIWEPGAYADYRKSIPISADEAWIRAKSSRERTD